MTIIRGFGIVVGAFSFTGCAGIDLGKEGLTYYEPEPYVLVSNLKDCTQTVTPMAIPGTKRSLTFDSGLGSADLSVALSNGMITSIGQKTDPKIPETITALVPALAFAAMAAPSKISGSENTPEPPTPKDCIVESSLYKVSALGKNLELPAPRRVP